IEITAWGVGDYLNPPEIIVEGKLPIAPQGATSTTHRPTSPWIRLGRAVVYNQTQAQANENKITVFTPYRIQELRLRLSTPPSQNLNVAATGLLNLKNTDFYGSTDMTARASGSRYTLGYPVDTLEQMPWACDGLGCEYLLGGHPTVLITEVSVNGDSPSITSWENKICSYEGGIDPFDDQNLVYRKLFYGDSEVSFERTHLCDGDCETGMSNQGRDLLGPCGDGVSNGDGCYTPVNFALLNCNYAEDDTNVAGVVLSGINIIHETSRGAVLETANGCRVEIDQVRTEPCYEWIGQDPSIDPSNGELNTYSDLEFFSFKSFSYGLTPDEPEDGDALAEVSYTQVFFDADEDGIPNDGDGSGNATDNPCDAGASCEAADRATVLELLLLRGQFCNPVDVNACNSGTYNAGIEDAPVVACDPTDAVCVVDTSNLRARYGACACDDNCGYFFNDDQVATDCVNDQDGDGVIDQDDNCPTIFNENQENLDEVLFSECDLSGALDCVAGDQLGDFCDLDDDNDGVIDMVDKCQRVPNPDQIDTDGDNYGDPCDIDDDDDGWCDQESSDADVSNQGVDACLLNDGAFDNCTLVANADQSNSDAATGSGDSFGDACDGDIDGDGVCDGLGVDSDTFNCSVLTDSEGEQAVDECPYDAAKQEPGECGCGSEPGQETDGDSDGVMACLDNCPDHANALQANFDGDDQGDVCDDDDDNDDIVEVTAEGLVADNCVELSNPRAPCGGDDSAAFRCLEDTDCPGAYGTCTASGCAGSSTQVAYCVATVCMTAPEGGQEVTYHLETTNTGPLMVPDCTGQGNRCGDDGRCVLQNDVDSDGFGDACDPDDDNDGVCDGYGGPVVSVVDPDERLNCEVRSVAGQTVGDNCPFVWNDQSADADEDGTGDVCDHDRDGDMLPNYIDNCPEVENMDQANNDVAMEAEGAKKGDVCDTDDDNDGLLDELTGGSVCDTGGSGCIDNCPLKANPDQTDTDDDGVGDSCDLDDDGDGVADYEDNCPLDANADQADGDDDGVGQACDVCPLFAEDGDGCADTDGCAEVGTSSSCSSSDDLALCGGVGSANLCPDDDD
ncbi:MAG: hypothetical protein CL902_02480, partial [Dehalococcoidia bacterium]|nr:hypothetical protein [Dehalococcoidia bacterium]